MFYSGIIFAKTNFNPAWGTALVGVANMLPTLGCTLLLGKFGRRQILWVLSFATAADLLGLGVGYNQNNTGASIALVLGFVIFFELSSGPILYIYMSETMTDKGVGLGLLVNWIITIIISLVSPVLLDTL